MTRREKLLEPIEKALREAQLKLLAAAGTVDGGYDLSYARELLCDASNLIDDAMGAIDTATTEPPERDCP